jgi:hypothetical protein
VGVIAGFFSTQQGITRMVVEGIFNFSTDITPVQLMMMLVFGWPLARPHCALTNS